MNLRFSQDVYEKFVFQYSRLSKKATKFDEISQLIWRLQSKFQINSEISSNSKSLNFSMKINGKNPFWKLRGIIITRMENVDSIR